MTNETKKTAVDSLLSQLQIRLLKIKSEPDGIVRETMINNFLIDTEQFKEIEKEQIESAFNEGDLNSVDYFKPENRIKESEQYYKENYGGQSW
jgi:hypothetical protein